MKAVIFDLDGTLIDSAPAIAAIGNRMLTELGREPLSLAEARSFIGRGAPAFVRQALNARGGGDAAAATARFHALYNEDDGSANDPFPGVEPALEALRARGLKLGICTNKPDAPTHIVLRALGWSTLFEAVVGGDTLPVRKPDPAPLHRCAALLGVATEDIAYVGDSEVDAETAVAARVPFLLFTEGYRKGAIDDLPHDTAFSDYATLPGHLARF